MLPKLDSKKVNSYRDTQDYSYDINLLEPHIHQKTILESKSRYRVVVAPRRFGKSLLSVISCVVRLLKGNASIWHCSPSYQNSLRIMRQFIKIFEKFPPDLVSINKTNMRIEFLFNDSFIEFKSLHDPVGLRGEGLNFLVIDECAFIQESAWTEILQPMLLTTKGEALFISSPNGKNWFYHLYLMGLDDQKTDYESFHYDSYSNPLVDEEEIEKLKSTIPSYVFEREYMARFDDDSGTVFKQVSRVVRSDFNQEKTFKVDGFNAGTESEFVSEMLLKSQNDEASIVFGIDFAQLQDFTVITVFDLVSNSLVEYERINSVLWEDIENLIVEMDKRWNPILILAEENNAKATIESLQSKGLPIEGFRTTGKSKPVLIDRLSLAIEQQTVTIPNDKVLIGELNAYAMTISSSGNVKYSAPNGLHDDCVISFALAYHCHELAMTPSAYKVFSVDFA